jgi:hypothetical protein
MSDLEDKAKDGNDQTGDIPLYPTPSLKPKKGYVTTLLQEISKKIYERQTQEKKEQPHGHNYSD